MSKCQPVAVLVDIPNGMRIGLNIFEMNEIADAHFESAGLLAPRNTGYVGDFQHLIINTNIVGPAYFITMKLRRVVQLGAERHAFAIVWEDEASGFHGDAPYHVMSVLSDFYDRFIDTYLDANGAACDGRYKP